MREYEFWDELSNIFNAVVAYQQKTIEFNKRFINPWIDFGTVFDKDDRNADTLAACMKAIEIHPTNAANWQSLGDVYLKMGKLEDAGSAYAKATELNPAAGWSFACRARVYSAQGQYNEAVNMFVQSLELLTDDKERAFIWNHLGETYRKVNDYENALIAFRMADECDVDAALAQDAVEDVTVAEETIEQPHVETVDEPIEEHVAELDASEAMTDVATEEDAVLESASDSVDMPAQDLVETITLAEMPAETTVTALPEHTVETLADATAIETVAVSDEFRLEPELVEVEAVTVELEPVVVEDVQADAASEVEAAVTESLLEVREEVQAGAADSEIGPVDTLKAALETIESIELDRENTNDVVDEQPNAEIIKEIISLTMDGQEAQNANEAIDAFLQDSVELPANEEAQEAVKKFFADSNVQPVPDPKSAHVWNELGNVYYKSGVYEQAMVSYKNAIKLDDAFALPYSNLGLTYVQLGKLDEAVMNYQRSIELFTDDADKASALNRLGNVYRRQNDYEKAISAYQRADDLDPHSASRSLRSCFSLLGSFHSEQAVAVG